MIDLHTKGIVWTTGTWISAIVTSMRELPTAVSDKDPDAHLRRVDDPALSRLFSLVTKDARKWYQVLEGLQCA